MTQVSDDAKAVVLLTGSIGGQIDARVQPLTTQEYTTLERWMLGEGIRPADLLRERGRRALASDFPPVPIYQPRLLDLLARIDALEDELRRLATDGIAPICRADACWPPHLREHLGQRAPTHCYITGNPALLAAGGIAIVGSRNVDADGLGATVAAARRCVAAGRCVVSGCARGVDQTAIQTALDMGGTAIGIPADSLIREAHATRHRAALEAGRLLLLTPHHPTTKFSVANAHARNRLIYAMADEALVISCGDREGGTWTGAVEELARMPHRPIRVRLDPTAPPGNHALLAMGAEKAVDT